MREWISEFIGYVNKNPSMYNRHIKNNVRLIEELLSRKNIYYKEADPVAFQKFARLLSIRKANGQENRLNSTLNSVI